MTDADLVMQSQQGSRAAFEQLIHRTARLVFTRIYLDVGDVHRAEDLTQETFLSAWRRIDQVTDPNGFRPWLMSVAKSTVVDAIRYESRKKRSGLRSGEDELAELADDRADPAQHAQDEESRQKVLALLRSLPEEYRDPLTLRYIGGADYQSIQRQLGVSNGSLRGLLSRGLAMLREKIGGIA